MSVQVHAAVDTDIDAVCDLLHDSMSAKISKDRWRQLLDYPWRPEDAGRGCVVVDGDRIVGFLGLIYADRVIGGHAVRCCNICAWYLLKEYRGKGIGQRIKNWSVTDPGQTYTIATPTAATARAFAQSGFRILDEERYILRRRPSPDTGLQCLDDPNAFGLMLADGDRTILEDHRSFNLRHLLFQAGDQTCYLVMQVKRKGDDIDYHDVLYRSDPRFLADHAQGIANILLDSDRSVFAFDKRFVSAPGTWEREIVRLPAIYRSPALDAAEIDYLYGEIVLLDLKLP